MIILLTHQLPLEQKMLALGGCHLLPAVPVHDQSQDDQRLVVSEEWCIQSQGSLHWCLVARHPKDGPGLFYLLYVLDAVAFVAVSAAAAAIATSVAGASGTVGKPADWETEDSLASFVEDLLLWAGALDKSPAEVTGTEDCHGCTGLAETPSAEVGVQQGGMHFWGCQQTPDPACSGSVLHQT